MNSSLSRNTLSTNPNTASESFGSIGCEVDQVDVWQAPWQNIARPKNGSEEDGTEAQYSASCNFSVHGTVAVK